MHRLFVAIRPPESVRELLFDVMEGMPDMRWQNDNQLHLTLRFIGEVERPVADDVATALQHIRFDRFQIALNGVGQYDEARPVTAAQFADRVPGSELAVVPGAAHGILTDRPDETVALLRAWLDRQDAAK